MERVDLFSILIAVFTTASWSLALLMSARKDNSSRYFLAIHFFTAAFVYGMVFAKFNGNFALYSALFPIQAFGVFFLFPSFYIYLSTLVKMKLNYTSLFIKHLVLPIIALLSVVFIHGFWLSKHESYLFYSEHMFLNNVEGEKFYWAYIHYRSFKILYILSSTFYSFLIAKLYTKHQQKVRDFFSSGEQSDLRWVKTTAFIFIAVVVFNIIIHFLKNQFLENNHVLITISYVIFSSFFWFLGYSGFKQRQVYKIEDFQFETSKVHSVESLTKERIEGYLNMEKPYLVPTINIYDFCRKFNTNRTYVSTVINKSFGVNFRTLINVKRIEEAKRLILSLGNNSIESLAQKSGFQSYNTFARVFKQLEGKSPAEYRKEISV